MQPSRYFREKFPGSSARFKAYFNGCSCDHLHDLHRRKRLIKGPDIYWFSGRRRLFGRSFRFRLGRGVCCTCSGARRWFFWLCTRSGTLQVVYNVVGPLCADIRRQPVSRAFQPSSLLLRSLTITLKASLAIKLLLHQLEIAQLSMKERPQLCVSRIGCPETTAINVHCRLKRVVSVQLTCSPGPEQRVYPAWTTQETAIVFSDCRIPNPNEHSIEVARGQFPRRCVEISTGTYMLPSKLESPKSDLPSGPGLKTTGFRSELPSADTSNFKSAARLTKGEACFL